MTMHATDQVKTAKPQSITPARGAVLQRKCACGGTPGPTGECAECQKKRMALQRKDSNLSTSSEVPPIVHEVLQSSGQPLDQETRAFFEPRFGHDFGQVRVQNASALDNSTENSLVRHPQLFSPGCYTPSAIPTQFMLAHRSLNSDGEATLPQLTNSSNEKNNIGLPYHLRAGLEQLSGMNLSSIRVHLNSSRPFQLSALAYTQGQDIYIRPGQERFLPHEGWHAVQQLQGRVKATTRTMGFSLNDDRALEAEADVMGAKALGVSTSLGNGHGVSFPDGSVITQGGHSKRGKSSFTNSMSEERGLNLVAQFQDIPEGANCGSVQSARASSLLAVGQESGSRTFELRLTGQERRVWGSLSATCQASWNACSPSDQSRVAELPALPRIAVGGGRTRPRTPAEIHARLRDLRGRIHAAMDITAPRATDVFAPIPGRVTVSRAGRNASDVYGQRIMLYHQCPPFTEEFGPSPVVSLYAHLQERFVNVGDDIPAGHRIGTVGDSGVPGRVHLHFSARHLSRRFDDRAVSSRAEETQSIQINPAHWLAAIGVPVGPVIPDIQSSTGQPANRDELVGPIQRCADVPAEQAKNKLSPPQFFPQILQRQAVIQRVTDQERYENTLRNAGTDSRRWDAGYQHRQFLGVSIQHGLHQELADRLSLAEADLQTQFPSMNETQIAQQIQLNTISGRRQVVNAAGGDKLSFHSFGLAIDINYSRNPFIGRSAIVSGAIGSSDDVINRIYQFMTSGEFHISVQQEGSVQEIYHRYAFASQAFTNYFAMRGNTDAIRTFLAERGEIIGASVGELMNPWQEEDEARVQQIAVQIEADAQNPYLLADMQMTGSGPRPLELGFMDLSEQIVMALTGPAGLFWGGEYGSGKDLMHFDWRMGTIRDRHRQ
jgi:murein DD-endopeptidase MepM/ murein hydrolase activator NlpD